MFRVQGPGIEGIRESCMHAASGLDRACKQTQKSSLQEAQQRPTRDPKVKPKKLEPLRCKSWTLSLKP